MLLLHHDVQRCEAGRLNLPGHSSELISGIVASRVAPQPPHLRPGQYHCGRTNCDWTANATKVGWTRGTPEFMFIPEKKATAPVSLACAGRCHISPVSLYLFFEPAGLLYSQRKRRARSPTNRVSKLGTEGSLHGVQYVKPK